MGGCRALENLILPLKISLPSLRFLLLNCFCTPIEKRITNREEDLWLVMCVELGEWNRF